jgi:hypothetical protein
MHFQKGVRGGKHRFITKFDRTQILLCVKSGNWENNLSFAPFPNMAILPSPIMSVVSVLYTVLKACSRAVHVGSKFSIEKVENFLTIS